MSKPTAAKRLGKRAAARMRAIHRRAAAWRLRARRALSFAAAGGRAAVGFGDGRIEVLEGEALESAACLQASGRVEALALAPDGRALFAGGWDGTIEGFLLPREGER